MFSFFASASKLKKKYPHEKSLMRILNRYICKMILEYSSLVFILKMDSLPYPGLPPSGKH